MVMGTILFVDDERNVLSSLSRELRDWSRGRSVEIRTASSAGEGLRLLESEGPDVAVVVSDLRMPGMSGSDFLLRVRELYPAIVTILLTGFSEPEELMRVIGAGLFRYIIKPWEPEYLKNELDRALEMWRLRASEREREKAIEEELRLAGEMQRALLRPMIGDSEGVEFQTSYRPMPGLSCGGDYFDIIGLGARRYVILVGDVSGHGVRAAFITGILKAIIYHEYIRPTAGEPFSPSSFLSWLNLRMDPELRKISGTILTFFAGLLDTAEGTLAFANAGHNHPFIVSSKAVRELTLSGLGIGFSPDAGFLEETIEISKGEVLFAYTDGLVEAGAKDGPTPAQRLPEILARTPYGGDFHERVLAAMLGESGADDFEDDVALLTAKLL